MTWADTFRDAAQQRLSLRRTRCERAAAYISLGQHEDARREIEKATKDYGVVKDYMRRVYQWQDNHLLFAKDGFDVLD